MIEGNTLFEKPPITQNYPMISWLPILEIVYYSNVLTLFNIFLALRHTGRNSLRQVARNRITNSSAELGVPWIQWIQGPMGWGYPQRLQLAHWKMTYNLKKLSRSEVYR